MDIMHMYGLEVMQILTDIMMWQIMM